MCSINKDSKCTYVNYKSYIRAINKVFNDKDSLYCSNYWDKSYTII